jgi:hypothetical protein
MTSQPQDFSSWLHLLPSGLDAGIGLDALPYHNFKFSQYVARHLVHIPL